MADFDPPIPPPPRPPPESVAARFVSESSLEAAKKQREADWKAAYERLGQEPPKPKEDDQPYDGRTLFEKLKENKDKKQEAFEEQLKFKNQFRALDEDEISFLDSLTDDNHEEEIRKQKAIQDQLDGFRQAVASRQAAAPPPTISPTSTSSQASSSKPKLPPKAGSKKKDLQKKLLAGIIVKKKPEEKKHLTGGVKRAGTSEEEALKTGEDADGKESGVKKRKVEEETAGS